MPSRPRLILETLRHLRAGQVAYLARRRLLESVVRPRPGSIRLAAAPALRWAPGRRFLSPLAGRDHGLGAEAIATDGRFRFINIERAVGWPPRWHESSGDKLWDYNLHYFEWLWALPFASARQAVDDWIAACGSGQPANAWEPYPTSLRLQNWATCFLGDRRDETEADPDFLQRLIESLATQATWLDRQLEYHLLANHLLENGIALAVAGSAVQGPPFDRLRSRGLAILKREIPEQILRDGMHFERSPMYHQRVVHGLSILRDTGDAELVALVDDVLPAALEALERLAHPDGEPALLNDSAFGIYPNAGALLAHAADRATTRGAVGRQGAFALEAAGYFGFHDTAGRDSVICDAGRIGPDHQPGHAHGDVFSFELSIAGRRVITDTGVWNYADVGKRTICRSTAAHNTVEIEGADQAEFWGSFRVGRRPSVQDRTWQPTAPSGGPGFVLEASHDGYRRLPQRATHRRKTIYDHEARRVELIDTVTADEPVAAIARLHFHPDCPVELADPNRCRVRLPDGRELIIVVQGHDTLALARTPYFPEFHREFERDCIEVRLTGSERTVRTVIEW